MVKAPAKPDVELPEFRRVHLLDRAVDDFIDNKNRSQHRPARTWHASKLGSSCGRQMWYDRMGFEPETWIKPQYSRDGDAGTALHDIYQTYIEGLGKLESKELKIDDNVYVIGGRVDGVLKGVIARLVKEGERALLELKTMKTEAWTAMPNHYKMNSYYMQMQVYLALRPDIVRGLLVCINRDDSRMKEFIVERNKPLGDYLLAKAAYLESCYQNKELPEAEPSPLCNYCPFQHQCESDDNRLEDDTEN